ncbi:hypothetical protein ASG36_20660 [Geodermatophilus sp. Leaf369]|uniref:hypothetical protein n=1 Tax=Geodermatophilus sp. Leaf369 TaxID=1736354 RepID=UPI0006F30693|nr:hypothetical protein [Geodermatophilus sp. Leaf369]KQS54516.1 hypothetical protein ASG36_20660 [Geodermatophilus sp. Leaf369]
MALAISDALASTGRRVHLIDIAAAGRSGLVSAASAELGLDDAGEWRRGTRNGVTLDRRSTDAPPRSWPSPPPGPPGVTVLDLGMGHDTEVPPGESVVVVCRPTVPAVRLLERQLRELGERPVVVAAIGRGRWPGEVVASLGSMTTALRSTGRVVQVPLNDRLMVSGLDDRPLPKAVCDAGLALFELLAGETCVAAPARHRAPTSGRSAR